MLFSLLSLGIEPQGSTLVGQTVLPHSRLVVRLALSLKTPYWAVFFTRRFCRTQTATSCSRLVVCFARWLKTAYYAVLFTRRPLGTTKCNEHCTMIFPQAEMIFAIVNDIAKAMIFTLPCECRKYHIIMNVVNNIIDP